LPNRIALSLSLKLEITATKFKKSQKKKKKKQQQQQNKTKGSPRRRAKDFQTPNASSNSPVTDCTTISVAPVSLLPLKALTHSATSLALVSPVRFETGQLRFIMCFDIFVIFSFIVDLFCGR
jgi:hypothetical protein